MRANAALLPLTVSLLLAAQAPGPLFAAPRPAPPPAGPVQLLVDASDVSGKKLHAHLVVPVVPGPLTLYYPKWIPGEHGPTGPIVNLAGLRLAAGSRAVSWRRDPLEMYSFRCEVPAGASSLEVDLDYLIPAGPGFTAGGSASDKLAVVSWNSVLLYPAGRPAAELVYAARLRLPAGWKHATALPLASESGDTLTFQPVSLVTLIDSPVLAGAYLKTVPLAHGSNPPHEIDLAADGPAALELTADFQAGLDRLVQQAGAAFGARHYGQYRWLLTLSDQVAHFGLEHHESSDDRVRERQALDAAGRRGLASLLAHEYVHSWNGKYRRPAELIATDYQKPIQSGLLWVYEGLTNYLGTILPPRSGLWTADEYREYLALVAATLDHRRGRTWRPLLDTAVAAQVLYGAPEEFAAWRRGVDFYDEGTLLWLEVDVTIRQRTQGQRSLDDFLKRFHGGQSGPPAVVPYAFEDVVRALEAVAPNDWAGFFEARVNAVTPRAPLFGIEGGGWRLVYTETPNQVLKEQEDVDKQVDLLFSLGLRAKENGTVQDVVPESPAARAGVVPGMKIVAAAGRRFSADGLREAIRAGRGSRDLLELILENGDYYRTARIDYHEGERYPHLERDPAKPDLLSEVVKPLAAAP